MEFSVNNQVVRLCVQGIAKEEQGKPVEAGELFLKAWNESTNDFEKFIAAHFVARHQANGPDRLRWLETALRCAQSANDVAATGALSTLYVNIAECYEDLGEPEKARKNYELASSLTKRISDTGPFYHGTKADLGVGDLLTAGGRSNYDSDITMNHIYFTALVSGAGLAAALAKGDGRERVYVVEPTGSFENDPNVTDKKFPGNLTRSYRSGAPLRIVGEVTDWKKQTPEDLQKWRDRLGRAKGNIIN